MDRQQALDDVVATLRDERDGLLKQVDLLDVQILEARDRLKNVDDVLRGLEKLNLIPKPAANTDPLPGLEDEDEDEEPDSDLTSPSPTRRVRSTQMLTDLISNAGREMSREEVVGLFMHMHGHEVNWEHPRNAIGNALKRAADQGKILSMPGDRFAPVSGSIRGQSMGDA